MASAEVMAPEGFRLESSHGGGTISWKGPAYWTLGVVGTVGLVLAGALLAIFVLTTRELQGPAILFGAGVLVSIYVLLVGLCNSTRVCVREGRLQAQHGPLPCPFRRLFCVGPRKEFSTSDVLRLNVQEDPRHRGGESQPGGSPLQCAVGTPRRGQAVSRHEPVGRSVYRVEVVTRDGGREPLLTGLSAEEAQYVERALAGLLDIATM